MINYLYSELNEDNNSFFIRCTINLFGVDAEYYIEIDTGCSNSNIAFKKFFKVDDEEAIKYKKKAIASGVEKHLGFGVSDSKKDRVEAYNLLREGKSLKCKYVNFVYNTDFSFFDYKFNHDVRVNFDRDGNSLLGMDILKDFDMHIGKSLITGKVTFLGCRKDDVSAEFIQAIQSHLGYVPIETMQLAYQQGYDQAQLARIEGIYTAACWRDYLRELKGEKKGLFRR